MSRLLLFLAFLAFVSLGLPDGVLGLVWPELERTFDLPRAALGLPLAVGALTYFVSGLYAGRLVHALGVGVLLAVSTVLVTLGLVGFACAPAFSVFLIASAIVGFGSGAVDAGLNVHAARHFAARHMAWLHAAYSAGATLGPALVTVSIAKGASFRTSYGMLAVLLGLLALAFCFARRLWSNGSSAPASSGPTRERVSAWAAARSARVRRHAALFFLYAGVEVGAGQWSYTIFTQGRGVAPATAGIAVTAYYAAVFGGRVCSGFIVERVGTVRLIRSGMLAACIGSALFAAASLPVELSMFGLALAGLALAPIFPGLMSETPRRVGERVAAHAVGFQVSAATAGVAVLPNVAGMLTARYGLHAASAFIAGVALGLFLMHEWVVRAEDAGLVAS